MYPLIESLRADPTTAPVVQKFLDGGTDSSRRRYEQRLSSLEAQRPLTDVERDYLQSVELLSLFNPYLVASVYADEGVTSEYLRHHFDTLSSQTLAELKGGEYIPLLVIGTGPNGTAAMGEVVRNNPELARQTLVVDAGKQPGGPFAVPQGAAWELNSANRRGNNGPSLPDTPERNELETVRAYGSPLRWYPGERANERSIRQGSINVTVDYLPTPDDLSQARYPTNEELQIILALQNALLTERLALETRVVEVRRNYAQGVKGDKLVTLEVGGDNPRTLTVACDAIIPATGLGEAGYGFKLKGSRAEKVLAATKGRSGFPKISQTLDACQALAGRSGERASPGETLVIYGKGNSADTLIEYIGSIFQGDNPRVRDVTKIYVIADGTLSARPRYAQINDLRPRNGRGNLIEQIKARVADIDFENQNGAPEERKIVLLDPAGKRIVDGNGNPIVADAAIAATGFRSELDTLLEDYNREVATSEEKDIRQPFTLPTNPDVPVAQTLSGDTTVLIVGTSSQAEFDRVDKLNQLPREAREALLRNGAENAVAIGFRAPDTQAAVNIWLNTQEITLEPSVDRVRTSLEIADGKQTQIGTITWLTRTVDPDRLRIPNNLDNELRLLSPLFAYTIGNKLELRDARAKSGNFTGEINFELTTNPDQQLGLTFKGGSIRSCSENVINAVRDACLDKDFQKYAFIALQKKRRNKRLDLTITFKNGFVDPANTFVQS